MVFAKEACRMAPANCFLRGIETIVGNMLVHDAPKALDGVKMRAIGRQPLSIFIRHSGRDNHSLYRLTAMIGGSVPNHVNGRFGRVIGLYFRQKLHRHCFPSTVSGSIKGASKVFKAERAVDVDPPPAWRGFGRQGFEPFLTQPEGRFALILRCVRHRQSKRPHRRAIHLTRIHKRRWTQPVFALIRHTRKGLLACDTQTPDGAITSGTPNGSSADQTLPQYVPWSHLHSDKNGPQAMCAIQSPDLSSSGTCRPANHRSPEYPNRPADRPYTSPGSYHHQGREIRQSWRNSCLCPTVRLHSRAAQFPMIFTVATNTVLKFQGALRTWESYKRS